MANTNTFYADDGNEVNYHSPNHQQAHSRFRRAVAVIVATLLCIVVSYCSIRSSTNANLRNQHSRNLTWHENLDEGSGDYFDSDGVNSTWDIPPECQPFDCDEEDEGNRNTSSDLQFDDDDDDDEESSSIIDTDDDATTKLEVAAKTDAVPSWMQSNLADVSSSLSKEDVPLFFHIPKAAGTAIQNLYWCMGLTLANEVGANEKFAHNKDTKLLEFQPFHSLDYHVVNVDTTSRNGILRAKNMGLVSSTDPAVDIVVSGEINYAAQNLFDEGHKGRVVAMFRHPVERAISMFYYLRKADWETSYHEDWNDVTILDWANSDEGEHSWVVRKLVGKEKSSFTLTAEDLEVAKEILRTKVLIGLKDRFLPSIKRFNTYLGIDDSSANAQECLVEFGGRPKEGDLESEKKHNADTHPMVPRGGKVWNALAKKNDMDVLLYEYAEALYEEQGDIIGPLQTEDTS